MRPLIATGLAIAILCPAFPALGSGYPRIANLWGTGPATRDYDKWARYGLLVMGGGSPTEWRTFRAEVRKRNPEILLLGTAPLFNIGPPDQTPWMKDEWYLRRPNGEMVRWWADQVYAPNLFNDDCFAALLEQTEKAYGPLLREGTADGLFYDSVVGRVSWYGDVDTDRDGKADNPAEVDPKWHARQNLFFDRLRERYPKLHIMANDIDLEHAPHVNGRLFEGGPLLDQLLDGGLGVGDAVKTLNTWMTKSLQPGITFALASHPLGWQGWRVGKGPQVSTPGEQERVRTDFHRMRLGLTTALMSDAYYAYDFGTVWYGLPFWYAEYDAPLGKPLGPAAEVADVPPITILDWKAGQDASSFVLDPSARIAPAGIEADIPDPQTGWTRLFATDFRKVPLQPGKVYRLVADCEVLRKPGTTFQFNVRTGIGGWEKHDKGIDHCSAEPGTAWRIEKTIIPDEFPDYALEWHALGGGGLRLKSLSIQLVNQSYYVRKFEGGTVLLNSLPLPIAVKLPAPMRRLKDAAAPRHVIEVDDAMPASPAAPGFTCSGAWEMRGGEAHYYGDGYRAAAKPGDTARWSFTSPSTDKYTILATIPGGKGLTNAAEYSVVGREGLAATISQRGGDGGWVKLFEVPLKAGERCTVQLRSAGIGATAADAIRAESATRYNDGSVTQTVALDGLDGAILLSR